MACVLQKAVIVSVLNELMLKSHVLLAYCRGRQCEHAKWAHVEQVRHGLHTAAPADVRVSNKLIQRGLQGPLV